MEIIKSVDFTACIGGGRFGTRAALLSRKQNAVTLVVDPFPDCKVCKVAEIKATDLDDIDFELRGKIQYLQGNGCDLVWDIFSRRCPDILVPAAPGHLMALAAVRLLSRSGMTARPYIEGFDRIRDRLDDDMVLIARREEGIFVTSYMDEGVMCLENCPQPAICPVTGKDDPFIHARSDSFNADSFIYKLIDEKYILPENVIVVGVSDYPKEISKIDDKRISDFVDFYKSYEEMGLTIVTKEMINSNPRFFDPSSLEVEKLHVSVDIDVGSRNAIYGARFTDFKGLPEKEIYSLIDNIKSCDAKVVSSDINEIDVWKAGSKFFGKSDRTYEVATTIGRKLCK
ncbi:MAG TPA: arginase family protein [Candidatus Methanofastidiosa archaeon]|nr:arginase family protein [Candidatus Methanofastidiosa archaeon]